jgi:outer membrane protein assembly factor BamB
MDYFICTFIRTFGLGLNRIHRQYKHHTHYLHTLKGIKRLDHVKKRLVGRGVSIFLIAMLCFTSILIACAQKTDNWPEFGGPHRDSMSNETGLLQSWPAAGPRLLWKATGLGIGYSSISIVNGKFYTMGDLTDAQGAKHQYVSAFSMATHQKLWSALVGPPNDDGSRCTPTIANGMAYAIGTNGDLVCLNATTGKEIWRKNFAKNFGGKMMSMWKYSESPLVDGDKLICTPGANDAMMVALNAKTGDLIWKCAVGNLGPNGADGAGYSSAVVATIGGVRQYVQLVGRGLIGVDANTGKLLWNYNRIANNVANIDTPIVQGDEIFDSTAYNGGSAKIQIVPQNGGFTVKELWYLPGNIFQNHHGGVVLVNGYLYGGQGQNAGAPTCIDWNTGKIVWQAPTVGGGSANVTYADGDLYYLYENGVMALIQATPSGFQLKGRFQTPMMPGASWAHTVILDGKLYIRHADALFCYDIKA